jgi:hypothetical protein
MTDSNQKMKILKGEEEHQGSIWKHPYMLYVVLTMILFVFLVIAAVLALKNGWLPNT